MEYKIINAMPAGEFEGKFGKTLKYTLMLEGEQTSVELNQKPATPAPKAGDVITGTIEEGPYGRKFKKESQSGGFGGNGKPDPATQKAIIRQNALTNAVNYCIAKTQSDKTYELSGKHIVEVATFFSKYSLGEITVTMTPEEIAEKFGYKVEPEPESEPEPEKEQEDEINLEVVPF